MEIPASRDIGSRTTRLFALLIIALFVVLGIIHSVAGIRGSDQFWYVADTESLLNGDGIQTNYIAPHNVANDTTVHNQAFVHNVPQIYLAAIPGFFLGAFNGWLLMNTLFTLATAFLLFITLRKFVADDVSLLAALLYLVMPLPFWHAYQPLAEAFHALLMTSLLAAYFASRKLSRWYLIGMLAVLLLLCRKNYLIVPPFLALLLYRESPGGRRLLFSLLFIGTLYGLYAWLKPLLPDTYDYTYNYAYVTVTGNAGEPISSPITDLVKSYTTKAIEFFKVHFFSLNSQTIFFTPFNLLALGTLLFWLRNGKKNLNAPFLLVKFSYLFLLLTAVVAWYQARYTLPFYPLVLFAFFVEGKPLMEAGWAPRLIPGSLVFALLLALGIDGALTWNNWQQGTRARSVQAHYIPLYDRTMEEGESVIYADPDWGIMTAYMLRPRNVFLGDEELYLASGRYGKLIESQNIRWFLTWKDLGERQEFPTHAIEKVEELPAFETEPTRFLYRLVARPTRRSPQPAGSPHPV